MGRPSFTGCLTRAISDVPAVSTVPAAGEYAKVPGTLALASSCAALKAVPYVMAAGAGQVMVGTMGCLMV